MQCNQQGEASVVIYMSRLRVGRHEDRSADKYASA